MSKDNNYMNMYFEDNYLQRYSEVDLFSTQGRIDRKQYLIYSIILPSILFMSVVSIAGLLTHLGNLTKSVSYGFLGLATIAMFFILVRLTIQRCHDFNKSGWLSIFVLIPFANLVFASIPGHNGLNQYGETPQPANGFLKVAFYGLLIVLAGSVIYTAIHLINQNVISLL